MAPFLEIITRAYRRPEMLAVNQATLDFQTDSDWQQTIIRDPVGVGVAQVNARMRDFEPEGQYVWILDDDDMCIRDTFVAELKQIVETHQPDVIMVKMDHLHRGILPDDDVWGGKPVKGRIGCSAYVVKNETWRNNRKAWWHDYSADYDFINAIFNSGANIYWYGVIASKCQRISMGAPE